jgi:hypothetical protein
VIGLRKTKCAGYVACVREMINVYKMLTENMKERDRLKDFNTDMRIILKWILKTWWERVDWINLAQNRDQRRAFVNTVMKF